MIEEKRFYILSGVRNVSLQRKRGSTLKAEVYTPAEVESWLLKSENIHTSITPGEAGESFAILFKPTTALARQDLMKIAAHAASLMDKDKPFSRISSIRLVKKGSDTMIRVGWST